MAWLWWVETWLLRFEKSNGIDGSHGLLDYDDERQRVKVNPTGMMEVRPSSSLVAVSGCHDGVSLRK